jgi:hypothetical protein
MFPQVVRDLLIANENVILREGKPWVGSPSHQGLVLPPEGIQVTSSKVFKYGQKCPVGPFSIEAAFILATQLAGINWKTLNSHIDEDTKLAGVYWMNAAIPYDRQDNITLLVRII